MANVPSAVKRNRQRLRRRQRNLSHLTRLRTSVKKVRAAVEGSDPTTPKQLAEAVKLLDKAAQKGVIKKQTAARKISRLTKAVARAAK